MKQMMISTRMVEVLSSRTLSAQHVCTQTRRCRKVNSSKMLIFSGSDLLVKLLLGTTCLYLDTEVPESDLYGEGQNLLVKHSLGIACLHVDTEVLESDLYGEDRNLLIKNVLSTTSLYVDMEVSKFIRNVSHVENKMKKSFMAKLCHLLHYFFPK
ncbi:hypothetical protein ACFX1Q_019870 [Malus domestica]